MGLNHYLLVGIFLFAVGIYTVLVRSRPAMVMLGIHLIFCAAGLNFIAFSHFVTGDLEGKLFAGLLILLPVAGASPLLVLHLFLPLQRQRDPGTSHRTGGGGE
jgi:NADH-quinone oxidoreductase subunit K